MTTRARYAVFDLDDTLYPADCGMWIEIRGRITSYMVERLGVSEVDAPVQRQRYFREYGTSLAGLRNDYPDIDTDEYLAYVHNVPYELYLSRNEPLSGMLSKLNMAKSVFTNADQAHAFRVLSALGVEQHFDVVVDLYATNFINKPRPGAFDVLFRVLAAEPQECVLIDDQVRNLQMAQSLGMATVLVRPDGGVDEFADFCVPDIVAAGEALQRLVTG